MHRIEPQTQSVGSRTIEHPGYNGKQAGRSDEEYLAEDTVGVSVMQGYHETILTNDVDNDSIQRRTVCIHMTCKMT